LFYYILDTETTGLRADYNEITEISIIRVDTKQQLFRNVKAMYPERASWDALKITRKTRESLKTGDKMSDVIKACNDFFDLDGSSPASRIIVGHNIGFDRRFLHSAWEEYGCAFPASLWCDTLKIMKAYTKSKGLTKVSHKLPDCLDLLGLKKTAGEIHSAKIDARNNFFLWQDIQSKIDVKDYIDTIPHSIAVPEYNDNGDVEEEEYNGVED
jgi:DNA polymerase III alpha subunit (gram-positive type)